MAAKAKSAREETFLIRLIHLSRVVPEVRSDPGTLRTGGGPLAVAYIRLVRGNILILI